MQISSLLVPFIDQSQIRDQLSHHNFIFLLKANTSSNNIVKTCIHADMYDSNTCICYNIVFFSFKYNVCFQILHVLLN